MAKNIIFCADGTWNGPGETDDQGRPTPSNVLKLFESLAGTIAATGLQNEMERSASEPGGGVAQIAKYIHGVGDGGNQLVRFAEGSTGAGILARLVRGYTFISRNYAQGDRIVITGFSRGAYTARALAGLIIKQGLLDSSAMGLAGSGDSAAYAAGMAAWGQYQSSRHRSGNQDTLANLAKVMTEIQDKFYTVLLRPPPLRFVNNVPLKAVAVWDTVGALGIPDYNKDDEARIDVFEFVDQQLAPAVESGFQAVAIDEMRVDFTPTLWQRRDQGGIEQVLFPGAHADVGGGYPELGNECGLSDGALQWMIDRMLGVGVRFESIAHHAPNPKGVAHRPWLGAAYTLQPKASREFPTGLALSQSAVDRINAGAVPVEQAPDAPYRPNNLAGSYYLMDWSGPASHVEIVAV